MFPQPSIKISSESHLESTAVLFGFKLYQVQKAFLAPEYFYRSSSIHRRHSTLRGSAASHDDLPYRLGIGGGDRCDHLITAIKLAPRTGLDTKPFGDFEKPLFSYL